MPMEFSTTNVSLNRCNTTVSLHDRIRLQNCILLSIPKRIKPTTSGAQNTTVLLLLLLPQITVDAVRTHVQIHMYT